MSASLNLLTATADRLFRDLVAVPHEESWPQVEAAGFPLLLVEEASGGFGGDWEDAFAVLRLAGVHALNGPLPELIAGRWAHTRARLANEAYSVVIALHTQGALQGDRFTGRVTTPWARSATHVLAEIGGAAICLPISSASLIASKSPAGEARDQLFFDDVEAYIGVEGASSFVWGALARTAQIAGALDASLALSIAYANERVQFGKPIGKLQAVQQALAEFAEEAAAVNCAGRAAAQAADRGECWSEIAAAKLRSSQAAAIGARVAHQVHGAIGFTREHSLHRYTARLVSWRSEYGGERYWSARLGEWSLKHGADGLWSELARRSDEQNKE